MTDKEKLDKLVAEIERRKKENEEKKYNYASTDHFWRAVECKELLSFYNSMQKEPTTSVWHLKNEEPLEDKQVIICISGFFYVEFYHKKDKRFYMFSDPKFYLHEIDRWAYTDDLLKL